MKDSWEADFGKMMEKLLGRKFAGNLEEAQRHMSAENNRLIDVLRAAGYKATPETAAYLLLTGCMIANKSGHLLALLVLTLKTMQMSGAIPSEEKLSELAVSRPQILRELLQVFLGGAVQYVGTAEGAESAARQAAQERASGLFASPWLRAR